MSEQRHVVMCQCSGLSHSEEDDLFYLFLCNDSFPFFLSTGKECIERRLTALQSGLCV